MLREYGQLKLAFAGCGDDALQWAAGCQLLGIGQTLFHDPVPALAAAAAARHGGEAVDSLPALLAHEPDGVVVATPDARRCEDATAALAAGCHVAMAPTLAVERDDLRGLVEFAREQQPTFFQPNRELVMLDEAVRRIAGAAIGGLFEAKLKWHRRGGVRNLRELALSALSIVSAIAPLGAVSRVSTTATNRIRWQVQFELAHMQLKLDLCARSRSDIAEHVALVVEGRDGRLVAYPRTTATLPDDAFDYRPTVVRKGARPGEIERLAPLPDPAQADARELRAWADLLRGADSSGLPIDGAAALLLSDLVAATAASAERGEPVAVDGA